MFAKPTGSLHCSLYHNCCVGLFGSTNRLGTQRWTCSFAAPPSRARLCSRAWPARFSNPSSFQATAVNIRASFPRQPSPSGKRVCHPAAVAIQVTVVATPWHFSCLLYLIASRCLQRPVPVQVFELTDPTCTVHKRPPPPSFHHPSRASHCLAHDAFCTSSLAELCDPSLCAASSVLFAALALPSVSFVPSREYRSSSVATHRTTCLVSSAPFPCLHWQNTALFLLSLCNMHWRTVGCSHRRYTSMPPIACDSWSCVSQVRLELHGYQGRIEIGQAAGDGVS